MHQRIVVKSPTCNYNFLNEKDPNNLKFAQELTTNAVMACNDSFITNYFGIQLPFTRPTTTLMHWHTSDFMYHVNLKIRMSPFYCAYFGVNQLPGLGDFTPSSLISSNQIRTNQPEPKNYNERISNALSFLPKPQTSKRPLNLTCGGNIVESNFLYTTNHHTYSQSVVATLAPHPSGLGFESPFNPMVSLYKPALTTSTRFQLFQHPGIAARRPLVLDPINSHIQVELFFM